MRRRPATAPTASPASTAATWWATIGWGCQIILDSFSAHTGADIRRWANKNKVELCFTPACAFWANPSEAHFGPLRQFTRPTPTTAAIRALRACLRWRNADVRHPDVLAAQRKERARLRSEKGIGRDGRPLTGAV